MGLFFKDGKILMRDGKLLGCCCECFRKARDYYVSCAPGAGGSVVCAWTPTGPSYFVDCDGTPARVEYTDEEGLCTATVYGAEYQGVQANTPEPDVALLPNPNFLGGTCKQNYQSFCCDMACLQWVAAYVVECDDEGGCSWVMSGDPYQLPCSGSNPDNGWREETSTSGKLYGPRHNGGIPDAHDLDEGLLPGLDCQSVCECGQWSRPYTLKCESTSAASWQPGVAVYGPCTAHASAFVVEGCSATLYGPQHYKTATDPIPANDLNASLVAPPAATVIAECCDDVVLRQRKKTATWQCSPSPARWVYSSEEIVECESPAGWTYNTTARPCTAVGYGACGNVAYPLPAIPAPANPTSACCQCTTPSSWSGACTAYTNSFIRSLGAGLSGLKIKAVFNDDNYGDNTGSFTVSAYEAVCTNGLWSKGANLGTVSVSGSSSGLVNVTGALTIPVGGLNVIIEASGSITWRQSYVDPDSHLTCPPLTSSPTGPDSLPVGTCEPGNPGTMGGCASGCGSWRLCLRIS